MGSGFQGYYSGINNYTLLRGTPEEVAAQRDAAIAAGIDVVGPECAIPLTTPLRNLKAIASILSGGWSHG